MEAFSCREDFSLSVRSVVPSEFLQRFVLMSNRHNANVICNTNVIKLGIRNSDGGKYILQLALTAVNHVELRNTLRGSPVPIHQSDYHKITKKSQNSTSNYKLRQSHNPVNVSNINVTISHSTK